MKFFKQDDVLSHEATGSKQLFIRLLSNSHTYDINIFLYFRFVFV